MRLRICAKSDISVSRQIRTHFEKTVNYRLNYRFGLESASSMLTISARKTNEDLDVVKQICIVFYDKPSSVDVSCFVVMKGRNIDKV